tara:strand:+ start:2228 stop:2473 length:246 start_codon:yes stop_codon:yes gene_type:complete
MKTILDVELNRNLFSKHVENGLDKSYPLFAIECDGDVIRVFETWTAAKAKADKYADCFDSVDVVKVDKWESNYIHSHHGNY